MPHRVAQRRCELPGVVIWRGETHPLDSVLEHFAAAPSVDEAIDGVGEGARQEGAVASSVRRSIALAPPRGA